MKINLFTMAIVIFGVSIVASAQTRQPSTPKSPIVVKSKQQVSDIQNILEKKPGNTNEDVVAAAGMQTRVAIFHDRNRENDNNEVHDGSDDVYYVLDGTATLLLGGTLVDPKEVSPGEWRAKTATGGQRYTIKKGDLVFVPRGTPHQRTVTGKGFSMILIKIFSEQQPAK
jgi:mannose-6-phosphate isomerase-like protein (cupin superfamily)